MNYKNYQNAQEAGAEFTWNETGSGMMKVECVHTELNFRSVRFITDMTRTRLNYALDDLAKEYCMKTNQHELLDKIRGI